jgi:hypothetical protein
VVALEAGYDLAALALCFVALAALLLARDLTHTVAGLLDFGVFGVHPLHGLAAKLENSVVSTLDDAVKSVQRAATSFESGLIDSFGLLIAIPLLVVAGVKAALEELWNHALPALLESLIGAVRKTAAAALAQVNALERTVTTNLGLARSYAEAQAASALHSAKVYADRQVGDALEAAGREISAGIATAERYADTAVAKLRAAEDAAIATAVGLAGAAKAAGLAAAHAAELEAERVGAAALAEATAAGARALTDAELLAHGEVVAAARDAASALASVATADLAAIAGVKAIAIDLGHDLQTIEGNLSAAGLAALIGSIPLLATLVTTIAVESGLEGQACRSKVKGICGTDPSEWLGLLEGVAFLTGALSLAEIVPVARVAMGELGGLIREAA